MPRLCCNTPSLTARARHRLIIPSPESSSWRSCRACCSAGCRQDLPQSFCDHIPTRCECRVWTRSARWQERGAREVKRSWTVTRSRTCPMSSSTSRASPSASQQKTTSSRCAAPQHLELCALSDTVHLVASQAFAVYLGTNAVRQRALLSLATGFDHVLLSPASNMFERLSISLPE